MKGIVDESEEVAVIYIDGKPSTKYAKKHEAEADAARMREKFPNKKIEIKHEVRETEAIKGADGKRCWKGKRYAGTENGKDKCVPVKNEAANPAQQAAIAVNMKKQGKKPKNEGVIIGHDATDPDVAVLGGAGSYKLSNLKKKAQMEANELAKNIGEGKFKNSAYNIKQLANTINTIVAAEEEMEKNYFGEDYTGEFAAEKTPAINPYGGQKDRQFRGAISETPTDNPTGASGEGGWRKYKPKSAGITESYPANIKQYARDLAREMREEGYDWEPVDLSDTEEAIDDAREQLSMFASSNMCDFFGDYAIEEQLQLIKMFNKKFGGVKEDTAYAGGMGQGGNAGQSYRKFKPKSAGTFREDLSRSDVDNIERFADKLYKKLGIDVTFTKHFMDRVNDERNGKPISGAELVRLFKKEYERWGKDVAQMGPDMEGTFKDLTTDINLPFVLRWDRDEEELDLVAKTVMRKKNFKTHNKEFPVESRQELDEKCWDTHKQVGMKKKGDKMVPNCVPKESAIMRGLKRESK